MAEPGKPIFQGPGPFHLPVVQRATASGIRNNGVTLTLYAVLPGRPEPQAISAQLTNDVARDLALHLIRSAEMSEGA